MMLIPTASLYESLPYAADIVAIEVAVPIVDYLYFGTGAAEETLEGVGRDLGRAGGGADEFHSFPESVTAFESAGTIRTITGGDGVARQMLEIPGPYETSRGTVLDGVCQFIKEADGAINHRLFVPRAP